MSDLIVPPDIDTTLAPVDVYDDFDSAAWETLMLELAEIMGSAPKLSEQANGSFAGSGSKSSYDSSNSVSSSSVSDAIGTSSSSPIFESPSNGAPLQEGLSSNFEIASTSALSGARSAEFGGEQIFDWNTTAPVGTNLSRSDLSGMDASSFMANQAIANSSNSFTVIPSTTGHEGLKATFDTEPAREAVVSYSAEFGEGTDFVKGGKLMGFNIGEGATGGNSDPNGGSVRLMFREEGRLEVYSYHQDQKSVYGDSTETNFFAKPGESFDVDLKVRANDAGQSNGGFDLYINGELVASQDNMMFTQNGGDINGVLADIFWGGAGKDWEAKAGSSVKIDDLEAFKLR